MTASRENDYMTIEGKSALVRFTLENLIELLFVTITPFGKSDAPENTCGRWCFNEIPPGENVLEIRIPALDLNSLAIKTQAGNTLTPSSYTPGKASLTPLFGVLLSSQDFNSAYTFRLTDTQVLKKYYENESHKDSYRESQAGEHPFFLSFHNARMRTLSRLFKKYIKPSSRVLDVGSGYSMFFLIGENWQFEITCCDIDIPALEKMRELKPEWDWVVADAQNLPWEDNHFDAVYAGEIIEHVPVPESALREWGRVLKPGGILILTTPNKDRMLSRARGEAVPVHNEHIRELSLKEIKSLLENSGFEILDKTGIYLEFLINWWRPRSMRADILTSRFTDPGHSPLYRIAMEMGRIAPSLAFDIVIVSRKFSGC